MEWAIATCALGGTLEEKLLAIAKAGFRAVEIFEEDLAGFRGTPRELKALAEDLGLRIVALQPLRDYEAMPEPHRSRNLDRAQRWFDLMEALGVELTYVCSNTSLLALDDPEQAAADLFALAEAAAQRGLRVGYEALAWGRHVRDWPQAWEIVRQADHPHLGLVLDSFHCFVRQNPLGPIAQLPGEKIFLVQLSDAPNLLMDPLALSRHHRAMPGQGDWPVEAFLQRVLVTGYRGPVSLEIFNEWFRAAPPEQVAQDGLRALKHLFDHLGLLLPPLPAGSAVQGVDFLEIAAEEEDLAELKDLLQALGFRLEARHPALDLFLYQAGEARLLLRLPPEEEGGREFPSVQGVGLRVGKAAPLGARARELGLSLVPRPEEGLGFPAVAAVGHTRLYLVDSPVLGAYRLTPSGGEGEEEAFAVDHFTNVVPRWELYSWLLIYKALFGFQVDPAVEVFDPYGMFYSRSVRSPNGRVRIPVNTSEGIGTAVSRFLRSLGHAGIQHVAFRTQDLLAFAERAFQRGFRPLRIPASYYPALAARHGLAPEMVEVLATYQLLYDRSPEGGEFLHLYTPTFRGRFFFEVVERRGGYEAYGAANTAVRLQAQAYELASG
ncbi:bifunctional sugar phosphate isomerase/epimerase/4-hydroxyphenylpyruvate dioxygenase family protein [Thermus thalpophilus]|uniref:bifunctional sugar phosphate isomerase/epimerase/4-hydroxyphenylpyruvate dioxygenase family protein n=1 Tax=Thermus thalpophilus TaxID=2908147 RepID=UPI001FAA3E53|nr:sugar phosphate isomerase/epimerase and 4-hydroxyphenylpyruvate domain-containing protein [Thermus thalpophilus]